MVDAYHDTIEKVAEITQKQPKVIHIVGGGAQNSYLNQMIADRSQLPVLAGPIEATAIGNIIIQAIGLTNIKNLQEGRDIVRSSFKIKKYTPDRKSVV